MDEKNLIIVSHCKDEVVYFYDKINHNSIVVLVSNPQSQFEREVFHRFIIDIGCRCIELNEYETFDINFQLSQHSKDVLSDLINIGPVKIYTQAKATLESDVISRRVFDYIHSLNLNNHLVPIYNLQAGTKITHVQDRYLKAYSNGNSAKLNLMRNTVTTISGFKLI